MDIKHKSIYSEILREDRDIYLYENSSAGSSVKDHLPGYGLIVLDGQDLLQLVTGELKEVAGEENVVVVGLGNKGSRVRDYTPTSVSESPFLDKESLASTGGGNLFAQYLEKELCPWLHQTYPKIKKWGIAGHSLGGLEVVNILLKQMYLFQYYICIEPSLWYDEHNLLDEAKLLLADDRYNHVCFFLAVADSVGKHLSVPEIREDHSKKGDIIRPNIEFADYLKGLKDKIYFQWKYYPEENHFSLLEPAFRDALLWMFHK